MDNDRLLVGVDIGGTATRFVSLDASGQVKGKLVKATPRSLGAPEALQYLFDGIDTVLGNFRPEVIGVGASGPIGLNGIIQNPATLPVFSGMELIQPLHQRYQVTCIIENDAVTAAYGENSIGASAGFSSALMITLGTGIGVCMLVEGKPIRGSDGIHPESGHMGVDQADAPCYCGKKVCWEQVASRTSLQRKASMLYPNTADGISSIRHAHDEALRGDPMALGLFRDYGIGISAGLINLLTIYRPPCVVIGGAGSQYFELYVEALTTALSKNIDVYPEFKLLSASLADFGGAIGAAMLANEQLKNL